MNVYKNLSRELRRGVRQVALAETPEAAAHAYAELKSLAERALATVTAAPHREKVSAAWLSIEAKQALKIGEELMDAKSEEDDEKQAHRRKFSHGKAVPKKHGTPGPVAAINPKP